MTTLQRYGCDYPVDEARAAKEYAEIAGALGADMPASQTLQVLTVGEVHRVVKHAINAALLLCPAFSPDIATLQLSFYRDAGQLLLRAEIMR